MGPDDGKLKHLTLRECYDRHLGAHLEQQKQARKSISRLPGLEWSAKSERMCAAVKMPNQQAHDAKEKQMEQSIPPPKQPRESVDMDYLTSKKSRPL